MDDVLDYSRLEAFPGEGDTGKIYVAKNFGLIVSAAGYDDISGFEGQTGLAVFQDGLDLGGRVSVMDGQIVVTDSGAGYTAGQATFSGGTRLTLVVGNGLSQVYRYTGGPDGVYIEISPSEVTSVNNKTGAVVLIPADIGATAIGHTHAIADTTGLQTALDGKEPTITTLPVSRGGTGANTAAGALTALGAEPAFTKQTVYFNINDVGTKTVIAGRRVEVTVSSYLPTGSPTLVLPSTAEGKQEGDRIRLTVSGQNPNSAIRLLVKHSYYGSPLMAVANLEEGLFIGGSASTIVLQATAGGWSVAPTTAAHKSTHATGGSDPLTPADIGAIAATEKAAANGVATLGADSKIPTSQLPDLAVTDFLGACADEAAMLAKTGQKGDWVAREDDGKVYVVTGGTPSQASSWTALSYPASPVLGVNGKTGEVQLTAADINGFETHLQGTGDEWTPNDANEVAGRANDAFISVISVEADVSSVGADVANHISNFSNPHQVTAAQIGAVASVPADASYVKTIRTLTSTQYDALGSIDPNTIYFII